MKWFVGVVCAVLITIGGFFYWGLESDEVEKVQQEKAHDITDPLINAQDTTETAEQQNSATEERVNEVLGE